MTPEDELAVCKADRENLHQRVKELADENTKLRERLGPRGLEVVMIGGSGHYVSEAVKAEIDDLRTQVGVEREIVANLVWGAEQLEKRPFPPSSDRDK